MNMAQRKKDYTPIPWSRYFANQSDVETNNGTFRVYMTCDTGDLAHPRIFALHGGGYSGLSWSLFAEEITSLIECQVVALDLRGHGETSATDPSDMSADALVQDVELVIGALYPEEVPPLVLVGHSMGGAVAVRAAERDALAPYIRGLAVIDVVEGTAMDPLASMQNFLRSRPTHFRSIENAIEWCLRSGQVRNLESARVSMPGQIINVETGLLATHEVEGYVSEKERTPEPARHPLLPESIEEEDEEEVAAAAATPGEGSAATPSPLTPSRVSLPSSTPPSWSTQSSVTPSSATPPSATPSSATSTSAIPVGLQVVAATATPGEGSAATPSPLTPSRVSLPSSTPPSWSTQSSVTPSSATPPSATPSSATSTSAIPVGLQVVAATATPGEGSAATPSPLTPSWVSLLSASPSSWSTLLSATPPSVTPPSWSTQSSATPPSWSTQSSATPPLVTPPSATPSSATSTSATPPSASPPVIVMQYPTPAAKPSPPAAGTPPADATPAQDLLLVGSPYVKTPPPPFPIRPGLSRVNPDFLIDGKFPQPRFSSPDTPEDKLLHPVFSSPETPDREGPEAKKLATPGQVGGHKETQGVKAGSSGGAGAASRLPERLPASPGGGGGSPVARYTWRIALASTEPFWEGWFRGLSAAFLRVRAPKVLLLASINGLDTELTRGQMQGSFQVNVLTKCGHAVHEDNPNEVAHAIAGFLVRHRLTAPTARGAATNLADEPERDPEPPRPRSPAARMIQRWTSIF